MQKSNSLACRALITMAADQAVRYDQQVNFSSDNQEFRNLDQPLDSMGQRRLIMPFLVNFHTHLELSFAHNKLPQGSDFSNWIQRLQALRAEVPMPTQIMSMNKALRQLWGRGSACIVDIGNEISYWQHIKMPDPRMQIIACQEVLGFHPKMAAERLAEAQSKRDQLTDIPFEVRLTPHSLYATGEELWQLLRREQKSSFSVHILESLQEGQMLRDGDGPIVDFLQLRNAWHSNWRPFGHSVVAEAFQRQLLRRGDLLVHLVQATDRDIAAIAENDFLACLCPRSNAFFHLDKAPIEALLESGATLLLGTDSLASNVSLDILDELQYALQIWPQVSAQELFAAITVNADRFFAAQVCQQFFPLRDGPRQPLLEIIFTHPIVDVWTSLREDKISERHIHV
jgi:cytosine/adenosine deaminase-related metal-dependent hydrolase